MTLPTPMKIVLAIFIIILIGLGFWLVDWQKKTAEIKQLEQTYTNKQAELDKAQAQVKALPQETQRKKDLERQLKEVISEQLTPETESDFVPAYIADIERLVDQEKMRMNDPDFQITSLTPGALTTVGGAKKEGEASGPSALAGYPTRTFQMQLTGRYPSVIDFLRQLGALKLKRLVTINRLTLSPNGDVSKGSPPLSVTMPITAYLRQGGGQ
ncbi:MAG: type 4a pilus biogenesis protein PilO [Vulcanimicrobiota bacterium]